MSLKDSTIYPNGKTHFFLQKLCYKNGNAIQSSNKITVKVLTSFR